MEVRYFNLKNNGLAQGSALVSAVVAVISLTVPALAQNSSAAGTNGAFVPGLLVRVPDSHIVYVLGESKCPRTDCFLLYRTNNDGSSFAKVWLPPIRNERGSPTGNLSQLVFANASHGYALEGGYNQRTLFVTSDGAKTWHKIVVAKGRAIGGVTVTTNHLYAMTMQCPHKSGNCTDFRLARSSLGAKSWASTPIPNNTFSEGGFIGSVAAFGSDVWFTEALHSTWLVTSRDGGRSFTKTSVPWPTLVSVAGCGLTATSKETLWAQCPTGMQVSYYVSSDGGSTWTPILASKRIMGTGGIYFDPVSSDLAVLDVGGPSFDIYRITNNAHTLVVGRLMSPNDGPSMVFTSSKNGLSISSPNRNSAQIILRRTNNGGTSWKRVFAY